MKRSLLVAIPIAALCLLIVSWRFTHSPPAITEPSPAVRSTIARSTSPSPQKSAKVGDASANDRPRFVAVASSAAQRHAAESDVILQNAQRGMREYRQVFRQNPVGNNVEIVRALLGKNSRGIRFLPADAHQNAAGQLLDRWDQPIFFHQISGAVMEVRSAGPDQIMWTADDEALP